MPETEPPEQLPSVLPNVDALQFRRAQPIVTTEAPAERACAACKQLISGEYYQVQNNVICPLCAAKILAGQQSRKPVSLIRPIIYGVGAAVAGCILYAIPLAIGFQIGIVALLVGWMVGKAIRHASYGTGGRRQQILAVALTYFAISTSIIPALVFTGVTKGIRGGSTAKKQSVTPPAVQSEKPKVSAGGMAAGFLVLAAVSPFLELRVSPVGGLISLFILFIGLQRAWAMTARHEIMVTGPFS
jgi:hypothetical protein